MSLEWSWVGGLTPTGVTVTAKVTSTADTRIAVSTSSSLSSPTYFGPVTPDADGMARLTVTGRTANTLYYFGIEHDGVLDSVTLGRFRTLPTAGSQASFTFATSSCAKGINTPWDTALHVGVSNHAVFDTIRNLAPLFFIHTGDLHYYDITAADQALFGQAYDHVLSAPRQNALYRTIPTVYVYDDHDGPGPNGNASSASRSAMANAYRQRVPSYTLPAGSGDNPVYHSFEVGRVLFIVSDTRHARVPGDTMLGAAQKTWMQGVLTSSAAKALVWVNPTPWMGLSSDTWAGFPTEQNELVAMFTSTGWIDRMVCFSGDYHGLALDTGGNSPGGFPVAVFGSMDSVTEGGGTPSNQYDTGPTSIGPNRYGVVEVEDSGAFVAITLTGYIGSTVWRSYTLQVPAGPASLPPPRALTLAYDDVLSRVRVSSTELDLPDNYAPLTDDFTRSVSGGWGSAPTGQAWANSGGAGSDYSVSSNAGKVAHTAGNARRFTSAGAYRDVDFTGSVLCPVIPTGGNIIGGFVARYQDDNNGYFCWVVFSTSGALSLTISRRVAGTFATVSTLVLSETYTTGVPVWIRFRLIGNALSAKAWKNGGAEPASWQASGTDSTFTTGKIGTHSVLLSGNSNTLPFTITYDSIATLDPDPVTLDVERSTNQVKWSPLRGGLDRAVGYGEDLTVDDYEFNADVPNYYRVTVSDAAGAEVDAQTAAITPPLSNVWLKSISRPFLNFPVLGPLDVSEVTRASRAGVFPVVGRSYPVTVTDLQESKRLSLYVTTRTADERRNLELLLASGDPIFVHAPGSHCVLPSLYAAVGDVSDRQLTQGSALHVFTVPLTEVNAPAPSVIGASITWAGLGNAYATWDELLDAEDTWAGVLELVGDPSDVIVE